MLDRRVQTFLKVARSGSFAHAGRELYISPVSVKKQIDSLESEIQATLFERSNRGVNLTEAGQLFYETAERMEVLAQAALDQIRTRSSQERPGVKIGTSLLRPCAQLLDLWARSSSADDFAIEIVPFDDGAGLESVIGSLGHKIDCFMGPCDAPRWRELCNIKNLGACRCEIAVPKHHPLASKSLLTWDDLDGQSLMLVKKDLSPVVDAIRQEIQTEHPGITIVDTSGVYDIDTFNYCDRQNILMETLDVWRNVHPGFVTIPMEWSYQVPYGLFYPKKPAEHLHDFIRILTRS